MKHAVLSGADQLRDYAELFPAGTRAGLLTNPTGISSSFEPTWKILGSLGRLHLTALFACEHGIHGEKQAGMRFGDEYDEELGIPVFSLYGKNEEPTTKMLRHVDIIVFDIQDLGVRFYTYLSTLLYTMRACAREGKTFVVLDRPNPLGGRIVEGGMLQPDFTSIVGACPMPIRTGLTIGEFASYINGQTDSPCELLVIPLKNWRRGMEFTETKLPWLNPSPNIPTLDSARVYAGTCLFEGTNLSEGRGTTRPFELIGAPWLDSRNLARRLNGRNLPGVHIHPLYFSPTFSKHQGQLCEGVQLFVTDPSSYQAVRTGLTLLYEIQKLHPDSFEWIPPSKEGGRPFIDLLTGSDRVRTSLHIPGMLESLLEDWEQDAGQWRKDTESYLLYKED